MAEIRWTEEAALWLEKIFDYIALDNPVAAKKVVEGIYEKVQTLRTFPEIGYKYREESDREIRVLLYGHYRIAYIHKHGIIEILGVFHSAMKIENYL
ncbi:MAG: type II toxin-antitoxin system RelE/ParE family toxin [Desulfobacteraceae bacterium]|nr:type II toxin-antitoxin system RelE/ParE family toxin [Desulfobacteraceae bacterium]